MKKFVDIIIAIIILLVFFSFYLKGWAAVACASGAVVLAALAFLFNKKN